MPVSPGGGGGSTLTNLSAFITVDVPVSANSTVNVTSLSLTKGTWLVNFQAELSEAGAAGGAELFVSTTTASLTGALGGAELTAPANTVVFLAASLIIVVAATTTYYLNLFTSGSSGGTVKAAGILNNFGAAVSGMNAVKIA